MIRPWKVLSEKLVTNYKIFATRRDRVVSPRTGGEHEVVILTGACWVNVLAITPDQKLVLVEQYRHGTRAVMREIPGGAIDKGETPQEAGLRELLEETGYSGKSARIIGKTHPNPAFQENVCYTVLVLDAQKVSEPKMEHTEDIETALVDEEEFAQMIVDGRITHSLVIVADHWRRLWRAGKIKPPVI